MATIGDGLIVIGIALCIVAFMYPMSIEREYSDYYYCIKHCPQTFGGYYKDVECPRVCAEVSKDYIGINRSVGG